MIPGQFGDNGWVAEHWKYCTIADLLRLTRAHLLRSPGCGFKTLADIEQALARYDWQLAPEPPRKLEYDPMLYYRLEHENR